MEGRKEDMNNTEKNFQFKEKSRLETKPIIFWVMCIICGIIAVSAIIADCILILKVPSSKCAYEGSILANGLAIVGLAITVWAGLNIANAVERKELEELSEKSKGLTREMEDFQQQINPLSEKNESLTRKAEDLDKQIEPLRKTAESINNTLKYMFQEVLLKTSKDIVSHWFLTEFSKKQGDKDAIILKKYFPELIIIENWFSMVYSLHISEQTNSPVLLQNANNGIQKINELIGEKNEREYEIGLNLVAIYLKFRRAEFEFYKGYATKNEKEICDYFIHAAEAYINLHEDFHVFLPLYERDCKEIPDYESMEEFRKISAYFANSIGDAYSKITHYASPLRNKRKLNGEMVTYELLKDYANKGVYYCNCATHWTKEKREVYFRNLGCAYERLERLEGTTGKYADEILGSYKKAFTYIVDQDVMSYRIQSVYHTLMQYSKKYLESKLSIAEAYKDGKSFAEAIQNKLVLKELEKEKLWNNLKDYYHIVQFAKRDNCRHHLQYEMEGFVMSIIIILKLSQYEKVNEIYELDVEECKKVLEENVAILKFMNIDDGYYTELVNRKKIIFGEEEKEEEK